MIGVKPPEGSLYLTLAISILVVLLVIPGPSLAGSPGTPRDAAYGSPTLSVPGASPSASSPDVWTEFQHDTQSTGMSGNPPVAQTLSWNSTIPTFADGPNAPFVGSPITGNGVVCVPEGDSLAAYNANTGQLLWQTPLTPTGGTPVVDETPLLWGGWVVVAEDCFGFGCSSFYILNSTSGRIVDDTGNGVANWGGNPTSGSPVPLSGADFGGDSGFMLLDHNGIIYTYAWNGTLTAIGNDGGVRRGGTATTSTPSVAYLPGTGWAAFFLDGRNRQVDAVGLGNGTALTFEPGYPAGLGLAFASRNTGSVSIANLTTPGRGYPVGFFGDDAGAGTTSLLYALNLTSATTYATAQLLAPGGVDSGLLSAPALVKINSTSVGLVVADLNGTVSRWNFTEVPGGTSTLTSSWIHTVGAPSQSAGSPAIAGNTVYVANGTGTLFALNVSTGAQIWNSTLSAPVRSSFALGYARLFVLSDVVGGGPGGNLTAFGPPAPPQLEIASSSVTPQPAASGARVTVKINVTTGPASGSRSPASGAEVNVTFPVGSPGFVSTTTNSTGTAVLTWTTPSVSPVNYTINATVKATLSGAQPANGSVSIAVVRGGSQGAPLGSLALTVTPPTSTVIPGSTQVLTFRVTNASSGSPVAGITVTASVSGALGSITPSPLAPTNASGLTQGTYLAPLNVVQSTAVLVSADAQGTGYNVVSSSAAIEILVLPSGTLPALSVAVSPATGQMWEGNTTILTVTVSNASSGKPVAGANVSWSLSASPSGTLSPANATTGSTGTATFTFTAGASPGATLAEFYAKAPGHAPAGAYASISVIVKPQAPTSNRTSTGSQGALNMSDYILLGIVIILALALIISLLSRPRRKVSELREAPPEAVAGTTEKPKSEAEHPSESPPEATPTENAGAGETRGNAGPTQPAEETSGSPPAGSTPPEDTTPPPASPDEPAAGGERAPTEPLEGGDA